MWKTKSSEVDINKRIALSIPDLAASLSCGISTADRIACEAGAIFYIGRRKFASVSKVREHICRLAEEESR